MSLSEHGLFCIFGRRMWKVLLASCSISRELVSNYISCPYSMTPSLIVKFLV